MTAGETQWPETPVLEGLAVSSRPLVQSDRAAILAAASGGELWRLFYASVPGPDTVDAWLARALRERDAGRAVPFVTVRAPTS